MNHVLLDHFLAAYEARSLGKAAGLLGLSQPALSKSIRKLESELGLPLFERTTSGIAPTAYADTLARRGQAVRSDLRNCIDELHKLRQGEVGEVRIGIAPALVPHFMPRVVAHSTAAHPSLSLVVTEGLYDFLASGVQRGELDFALTNLPAQGVDPGLAWSELFRDRFVVCCGSAHPLARQAAVRAADLLGYPWITPPREGLVWQRLAEAFAAAQCAPPRAAIETNSAGLIKALLCDGPYLTCVPRQFMLPDLRSGAVMEVPVPGMAFERVIAVVSRAGREQPRAAMLTLQACQAVAAMNAGAAAP